MRKIILLILSGLTVLSILSCENNCKESTEFQKKYFSMLDTIASYYKLSNTAEDIPIPLLWERSNNFYNYKAYLEYLTQHEFRNMEVEHLPIYQNKSDFKADMKDLKKWYKENKCGMTIEKADSIVNSNYEQR